MHIDAIFGKRSNFHEYEVKLAMPFLKIELSGQYREEELVAANAEAREIVASTKGESPSMIQVSIATGVSGTFGTATGCKVANVHLTSFAMGPEMTAALTKRLSRLLWERFAVSADRAFMFFSNVEARHLTSWNGRTFAEILSPRSGGRSDLERRVRGRLMGGVGKFVLAPPPDARPLSSLHVELWDPFPVTINSDEGTRDGTIIPAYLGNSVTNMDGYFDIFFDENSWQNNGNRVLELRIYEPDQLVIVNGLPARRRFLSAIEPIPDPVSERDLLVGTIIIPFYEYDPDWGYPYALPESIRHGFSARQAKAFESARIQPGIIGRRLAGEFSSAPDPIRIDDIQNRFPPNETILEEREEPGKTRTDAYFADRIMNCMVPPLFLKEIVTAADGSEDEILVLDLNWAKFERRSGHALLSFQARFKADDLALKPVSISVGLDNEDNPEKFTMYTPESGESWHNAKRLVRSHYNNLIGQVQGHLAACHFNLEQYGIAFLQNVRANKVRDLLFPFIREILAINEKGRGTLIGGPAPVVFLIEPVTRESIGAWVVNTLGRSDWKGYAPRQAICGSHDYANAAALYWSIMTSVVDDFFKSNGKAIATDWHEIKSFSDALVSHSMPYAPHPMEQSDHGLSAYSDSEVPADRAPGEKAISRITTTDGPPTPTDLANLAQACSYIIFFSTFFHSWIHYYMRADLGELRYSGMLRNGGMGPENDDNYLASPQLAAISLGATFTLGGMDCGYMIRNEDGDASQELIARLKANTKQFFDYGFDVHKLCARMNT